MFGYALFKNTKRQTIYRYGKSIYGLNFSWMFNFFYEIPNGLWCLPAWFFLIYFYWLMVLWIKWWYFIFEDWEQIIFLILYVELILSFPYILFLYIFPLNAKSATIINPWEKSKTFFNSFELYAFLKLFFDDNKWIFFCLSYFITPNHRLSKQYIKFFQQIDASHE